jgi:hypothetical protein
MKHDDLIQIISVMNDRIKRDIPYVNKGGCGFFVKFAVPKIKELLKKHGIKACVFPVAYDDCRSAKFINDDYSSCSHFMVKVVTEDKNIFFDGHYVEVTEKNLFPDMGWTYRGRVNYGAVVEVLKDDTKWNKRYNRGYNKKLEQIINKHLS